jgi:hypothetical protein
MLNERFLPVLVIQSKKTKIPGKYNNLYQIGKVFKNKQINKQTKTKCKSGHRDLALSGVDCWSRDWPGVLEGTLASGRCTPEGVPERMQEAQRRSNSQPHSEW